MYDKEKHNARNRSWNQRNSEKVKASWQRRKYTLACRWKTFKATTKQRKILLEITKEQFDELTKQKCYYCDKFSNNKNHCRY
jgi:hypothetical protein